MRTDNNSVNMDRRIYHADHLSLFTSVCTVYCSNDYLFLILSDMFTSIHSINRPFPFRYCYTIYQFISRGNGLEKSSCNHLQIFCGFIIRNY